MNCWIAQLKPFSTENRQRDSIEIFQKNSISKNICGMGWNLPDIIEYTEAELKLSDYKDKYKNDYSSYIRESNPKWSSRHFTTALNAYQNMRVGDYILTRLFKSNECYIGKVTKEAYYNNYLDFEESGNYSWIVNVQWKAIGHFSNIPNSLRGIMQGRMNTIKCIPTEAPQNELIRNLFNDSINKVGINAANFHLAIDPLDLEDLVALYIAYNNPGFNLLPSSCKISEPEVEYKLVCGSKRITCQVKSNKEIDVSAYISLCTQYDRIYLFSGKGYDNAFNLPQNLFLINKTDLFEVLLNDFNQKGYFYDILKDYFICTNH